MAVEKKVEEEAEGFKVINNLEEKWKSGFWKTTRSKENFLLF